MNDESAIAIPINYPEWMEKPCPGIQDAGTGSEATYETIAKAGGIIHDLDCGDTQCKKELSAGMVWALNNLDLVTCPDCLRVQLRRSWNNWQTDIRNPIRQFLLSMGEDRDFASECEMAEMMRIVRNHPEEWRKLGERRK